MHQSDVSSVSNRIYMPPENGFFSVIVLSKALPRLAVHYNNVRDS